MSSTTQAPSAQAPKSPPDAVFISYSSKDEAEARGVCLGLRDAGISAWLAPEKMMLGWWPRQIVKAIRDCRVFVVILSPESNRSVQVRREVYLATSLRKTIIPLELAAGDPQDDMAYLLAGLQIVKPFDVQKLIWAVNGALVDLVGKVPALTMRRVSAFMKWNAALAGAIIIILTIWLQQFTEVGWPAYLVLAAPLIFYQALPDFWRPWAAAVVRAAWTTPAWGHRLLSAGATTALALCLAWTFTVGTVVVTSKETADRSVALSCDPDGGRKVSLEHPRKFLAPSGKEVTVCAERLPERPVKPRPRGWAKRTLAVPSDFLDSPTVLVIQDQNLKHVANQLYKAHLAVERRGQIVWQESVDLAAGSPLQAIPPFWIGCTGREQVLDPTVRSLVEEDPPIDGAYPCLAAFRIVLGDRLQVTVEDAGNRFVRGFPDVEVTGTRVGNQYGTKISSYFGRMRP
jgi:hypothetical protein